jgi:uncharacterized membrane protein
MYQTAVVTIHSVGAIGALITGFLALRFPNGTPRHRAIGKLYLLCWSLLTSGGAIIGSWNPGFSVFELLNLLGLLCVLTGYCMIMFRKRIGHAWRHLHYNWMAISVTFLVNGTINVVMRHTLGGVSMWFFYLTIVVAAFATNWYVRQVDQRYGYVKEQPAQSSALKKGTGQ